MFKFIELSLVLLSIAITTSCTSKKEKILVFSKTTGFRHNSIETGIETIKKLGAENGIMVDATEDATFFTEEILKQYSTILFLNTRNGILDESQQSEMERYIQAGGGFVGIHAATDTEQEWPCRKPLWSEAHYSGHGHQ